MAIDSFTINHGVEDSIKKAMEVASHSFDNISADINSTLTANKYNGAFVGISKEGLLTLKQDMEKYIKSVQNEINDFDANGDMSGALQGYPLGAAQDFVQAVKFLLSSYVSSLRMEQKEIDEAIKNYTEASNVISKAVTEDAVSIRNSARNINLDDV